MVLRQLPEDRASYSQDPKTSPLHGHWAGEWLRSRQESVANQLESSASLKISEKADRSAPAAPESHFEIFAAEFCGRIAQSRSTRVPNDGATSTFGRRLRPKRPIVAVIGNSSPLVDTSCRGISKCLALLSGMEPTQMLPAREEVFKPAVIAHDAVDDTSSGAHNLCGQ